MDKKQLASFASQMVFSIGGACVGGYIGAKIGDVAGFIGGGTIGFFEGAFLDDTLKYKLHKYFEEKQKRDEKAIAFGKYVKKVHDNEREHAVPEYDRLSHEQIEKNFAEFNKKISPDCDYYNANLVYSVSSFQEAMRVRQLDMPDKVKLSIPAQNVKEYGFSYASDRFLDDEKYLDIKINGDRYKFIMDSRDDRPIEEVVQQKTDERGNQTIVLEMGSLELVKVNNKEIPLEYDNVGLGIINRKIAFSRLMDEVNRINQKVNNVEKINEKDSHTISLKHDIAEKKVEKEQEIVR